MTICPHRALWSIGGSLLLASALLLPTGEAHAQPTAARHAGAPRGTSVETAGDAELAERLRILDVQLQIVHDDAVSDRYLAAGLWLGAGLAAVAIGGYNYGAEGARVGLTIASVPALCAVGTFLVIEDEEEKVERWQARYRRPQAHHSPRERLQEQLNAGELLLGELAIQGRLSNTLGMIGYGGGLLLGVGAAFSSAAGGGLGGAIGGAVIFIGSVVAGGPLFLWEVFQDVAADDAADKYLLLTGVDVKATYTERKAPNDIFGPDLERRPDSAPEPAPEPEPAPPQEGHSLRLFLTPFATGDAAGVSGLLLF